MNSVQIKELYQRLCVLEGLLLKAMSEDAPAYPLEELIRDRAAGLRDALSVFIELEASEEISEVAEATYEPELLSSSIIDQPEKTDEVTEDSAEAYYTDETDDAIISQPSITPLQGDESIEILDDEEIDTDCDSVEGKHPDLSFITINERARFRMNLFDSNKERFDEAMAMLQSLTGYSEARRYLIDDLEWNPAEDEIQAEFLEKLYICFKEAR